MRSTFQLFACFPKVAAKNGLVNNSYGSFELLVLIKQTSVIEVKFNCLKHTD